jgi:hypothetical protein
MTQHGPSTDPHSPGGPEVTDPKEDLAASQGHAPAAREYQSASVPEHVLSHHGYDPRKLKVGDDLRLHGEVVRVTIISPGGVVFVTRAAEATLDIERLAREAGIPCDGAAFGGRPVDALRAYTASVLEEAARAVEPRNAPEDWTEYARIKAECADRIRALKPK